MTDLKILEFPIHICKRFVIFEVFLTMTLLNSFCFSSSRQVVFIQIFSLAIPYWSSNKVIGPIFTKISYQKKLFYVIITRMKWIIQISYRVLKVFVKYCFFLYMVRCAIWYPLCSLKSVKNTHGGVLIFIKL